VVRSWLRAVANAAIATVARLRYLIILCSPSGGDFRPRAGGGVSTRRRRMQHRHRSSDVTYDRS
jgi:hypothetical protein